MHYYIATAASTTTIQFIYPVKQTVTAVYTCLFWKAKLQTLKIFKELSFGMLMLWPSAH
jgi:hypothetical protein